MGIHHKEHLSNNDCISTWGTKIWSISCINVYRRFTPKLVVYMCNVQQVQNIQQVDLYTQTTYALELTSTQSTDAKLTHQVAGNIEWGVCFLKRVNVESTSRQLKIHNITFFQQWTQKSITGKWMHPSNPASPMTFNDFVYIALAGKPCGWFVLVHFRYFVQSMIRFSV